jgi:erythromycin esterase-like protein
MSREDFFSAEQNARLVKGAEEYYRSMFQGRPSSWNIRDTHMTDTLDALDKHLSRLGKKARIVVWAHNSHIGDARATDMSSRGEVNIGQLMRERHKNETMNIGFTTYTGSVTAASDWDEPEHRKKINPALPSSYEHLFSKVGNDFILDLNASDEVYKLLMPPMLQRFIGVIYSPKTERWSHYYHCSLPLQYDHLIHINQTHAVHPLAPSEFWNTAMVATEETYPSGL